MKILVSIVLLFSLSLQCFSRLGVWISYEMNKDYIANVLCINRDKPEMHCNGKCYLRKKLRQDEQHKEHDSSISGNKFEITLFCATENQHLLHFDRLKAKHLYSPVFNSYAYAPTFYIFHPPRCV